MVKASTVNRLLLHSLRPVGPLLPRAVTGRISTSGRVRARLPNGQTLRMHSAGGDLAFDALFWRGLNGYEASVVRLYWELLREANTVFDVGANTGLYALLAGLQNPKRQVFAFEPVPRVFSRLERNIRENRLRNVTTFQGVATNFSGEATLYIPRGDTPIEASTLPDFRAETEELRVPATTLDAFALQQNLSRVDLLKIDTEATEPLVLQGARELLERDAPLILCEVLHGRTEEALHEVLDALDYRFFAVTPSGLEEKSRIVGDPTYENADYLFVPSRREFPFAFGSGKAKSGLRASRLGALS